MPTNVKEALKLLGIYTAGSFDIWTLAGPVKASCRAHILSTLVGGKVPQSKSGVNALRDAFYAVAEITGEYPAERERNFIAWAKERAQ